ncbi:MAG: DNA polymerase I [Oscillospiraceae bacterium]|nr:DNA polymerase I [Oscillospiraceae bacterium]
MKLLILDGNSVINRAFFGVKPLTTKDGLFTHAIYGFLNILERMEKEEQPEAVCVAFDLHGSTFRHLKYDGYKATRHGMPEELAMQMPVMKDVLRAMNIPIYECQGWEADDVIGTVGRICSNNGWECVVVTGDRDSLQLIDENVHVKLVITKGGQTNAELYTEEKFRAEYGFEPKKLIDLKALMGDSSDNIPGVAGVGPKTATDLLLKFGSLDGVYANLEDKSIRPKLREKLEKDKDNAYLSFDLATIRPEAPIDFEPKDAIVQPYNRPQLYKLFQKLEFVRLIDRYGLRGAELEEVSEAVSHRKAEALPKVDSMPESVSKCAVYLAGDGSLGLAWEQGVCVLPPMEVQMGAVDLRGKSLVMHDSKTTMHRLDEMGISFGSCAFDTALAAYDLNPSQSDYPVSKLATNFLGISAEDEDAAACAEALWNLAPILEGEIEKNGMTRLYREIELPLCTVLYRMENRGIAVDEALLQQFGQMLYKRIDDCEKLIFSYSGEAFNINSTKQLGELLFDKLGLPPVKKTKTGYSTNAEVLEKLKNKHPIIPAIMDYRMLTKLKSTYADGLVKVICPDGRIRTTFQNLVTATGRLSSTEPNLQNIPVRTDLGAEIRKMFVPKKGCVLVDADYSQIELRVLAHIADDRTMQEAFCSGLDIHTATAAQVFDVPMDAVTSLQRRHAKAVNFGIVYGISEFSLAEDIGVSRYEAKAYIDNYLTNYSGVRTYMKKVVEDAREIGYTQTLYGRRRYIPELKSSNFNIRSGAERIALNTPIQGTAADLIKLAMIRVENALNEHFPEAELLLQVHDELIVECPEAIAPQVAALVSREMEKISSLKVPLTAEAKFGKSWYDAK